MIDSWVSDTSVEDLYANPYSQQIACYKKRVVLLYINVTMMLRTHRRQSIDLQIIDELI